MSADIIDTIDSAIRDWRTSGDAMRWHPRADFDTPEAQRAEVAAAASSITHGIRQCIPALVELGAHMTRAAAALRALPQPSPYRDNRPRWQSPHGPARRVR